MEHSLTVSTNGDTVGRLGFDALQDQYSFEYSPQWQDLKNAFSLSPHIRHTGEAPPVGAVHRFLGNLLPEGRALEVASIVYQMSRDNVFGLIRLLGKEPVGAFSFTPFEEGQRNAEAIEPIRREIPDEELSQRIRERDNIPFPVWDQKVRLSVAGYQDKLQVMVEGNRISLVDGSLSSTHILKPESRNPHTPFMVANEHFCMTLAAAMGLPTAPVSVRRIPDPILLIERFDRVVTFGPESPEEISAVERRHVIDGCQALDLPATFKYERNFGHSADVRNIREGVSFARLFSLQEHFEQPAGARTFMLRWALFQLLIGNSDAHGKNISFFLRRTRLSPAPLYDLVSVNAYGDNENVEQEMAMAYGDAFLLEEITPFELAAFGKNTGTRPALLAREIMRMAQAALRLAPELADSAVYVGDDERARVQNISDFVCSQADRLLRLAPEVPKVSPALL
jgi:serine/threonine-protein kinase HipA